MKGLMPDIIALGVGVVAREAGEGQIDFCRRRVEEVRVRIKEIVIVCRRQGLAETRLFCLQYQQSQIHSSTPLSSTIQRPCAVSDHGCKLGFYTGLGKAGSTSSFGQGEKYASSIMHHVPRVECLC